MQIRLMVCSLAATLLMGAPSALAQWFGPPGSNAYHIGRDGCTYQGGRRIYDPTKFGCGAEQVQYRSYGPSTHWQGWPGYRPRYHRPPPRRHPHHRGIPPAVGAIIGMAVGATIGHHGRPGYHHGRPYHRGFYGADKVYRGSREVYRGPREVYRGSREVYRGQKTVKTGECSVHRRVVMRDGQVVGTEVVSDTCADLPRQSVPGYNPPTVSYRY